LVGVEVVEAVAVVVVAELVVVVFAFWSGTCTAGLKPAVAGRLGAYPAGETREKLMRRRLKAESRKPLA
jgi:hypothetical protein